MTSGKEYSQFIVMACVWTLHPWVVFKALKQVPCLILFSENGLTGSIVIRERANSKLILDSASLQKKISNKILHWLITILQSGYRLVGGNVASESIASFKIPDD